ncbi:MAG: SigB/SigF/SigG family RNA polymerase sigma factor [Tissierellia bacterium]|nr:SigB/SigF/SigG family RNA polymerase sigma factor [Tissierellia bacterium]
MSMNKDNSDIKTKQISDLFIEFTDLRETQANIQAQIKMNYDEDLEKELKRLKNRIKLVRDRLIEHHLYIAEILSKKYVNKGIEFDDLYQVASLGLIFAIDRFDVSKGYEFSSYATPTIVGEIKRYFRDKSWVIKVPRRIQELSKKVNMARVELSQELQKNPSIDEIAEYLEISTEEVIEVMDASQVYSPQSLDRSLDSQNDDKDVSFGDLLGFEDKNYESIETMDFIKNTMDKLKDIEKKILVYRYFDKMTQIAIATELGVSQMTVSRIEKKIIKKFRQELDIMNKDLTRDSSGIN